MMGWIFLGTIISIASTGIAVVISDGLKSIADAIRPPATEETKP